MLCFGSANETNNVINYHNIVFVINKERKQEQKVKPTSLILEENLFRF